MNKSATEQNMRILTSDLNNVIQDINGLVKGIPGDLGNQSHKFRRQLESTVRSARHRCRQLERQTRSGMLSTGAWVRERPYSVAGAVAAVGVLIGILISWRR